ncbi:MAG: hydroxymethylglutaryl-CoA lyase [Thermomicrobia bacterium]|nr:hydroxymethylglutaryl-CoA lyase [Thermomicrobia bacterium]
MHVRIVEVGPRDGLQNEPVSVSTDDKIRFIDLLADAGLPVVEATSFVSPQAIPALADADQVFPAIAKRPGTRYPVLVPNLRGLDRALAAGVREIALFTAASETFTKWNINMTVAESLAVFAAVIERARPAGLTVRGYVSTAFGCPYEGHVPPEQVVDVTRRLFALGVAEVSIGDTIGVATPKQITAMVPLLNGIAPIEKLALHLHDTRGTALANAYAGLQAGRRLPIPRRRTRPRAARSLPRRLQRSREEPHPRPLSYGAIALRSRNREIPPAMETRNNLQRRAFAFAFCTAAPLAP